MKSLRNPIRRPTHPGAVLREDVLPGIEVTQGKLAELLGVSRLTVSQLMHEHRALSPDMAMRLERLLGTSTESWLRMQEAVDLWEAGSSQSGLQGSSACRLRPEHERHRGSDVCDRTRERHASASRQPLDEKRHTACKALVQATR